MRFLASCDFAVVRALRTAGHDVTTVSDVAPGSDDHQVAALAVAESRVLLTEDKDFGRLAHASGGATSGVIFIRFPASARDTLPASVLDLIARHGAHLHGAFTVVGPGRVRLSRKD